MAILAQFGFELEIPSLKSVSVVMCMYDTVLMPLLEKTEWCCKRGSLDIIRIQSVVVCMCTSGQDLFGGETSV